MGWQTRLIVRADYDGRLVICEDYDRGLAKGNDYRKRPESRLPTDPPTAYHVTGSRGRGCIGRLTRGKR